MKRSLVYVLSLVLLVVAVAGAAEKKDRPLVQLAILLDTSNSMDGLISQAKTQLWKIVNECAALKRDEVRPELWVALYEYGNNTISAKKGYVRMVLPLTTDLDAVSEKLFELKTNGGSEYCGTVIENAVESLAWSKDNNDLKLIFIAGNEPFTQGRVDYRKACKAAVTKGITVNTIHCGNREEGIRGKWEAGALLADGQYMNINQDRKIVHIAAPQDKEIVRLGGELNSTYIAYGRKGKMYKSRQSAQDKNAFAEASGVMLGRAVSKSSHAYRNAAWDIVDAVEEKKLKVEDIKVEDLPENMRKMTVKERKAYVQDMLKKRAALQQRIKKLNAERNKFVAAKMKEKAKPGKDTLDAVMTEVITRQAKQKNFNSSE